MRFLVFIAPKDFKDESLSTVRMFLDKWDVGYDITSYSTKDCVGYHGAVCKPGINTGKVLVDNYDGIILVDGKGIDAYKIFDFRPMLDLMLRFNERKKLIVAINNAIKVPARANIIRGRKIAAPEDAEVRRIVSLFHGTPSDTGIEIDGNIATISDFAQLEPSMQRVLEHIGVG